MDIEFDYYYGAEAEQFSFYRVPRLLIKDERFKGLSSDAKLLYGLMLDRMSLSMKNNWFDDKNRAYIIYTVENVTEDLGCGRDKAIKVLAELDIKKGIGLIEKVRRGLGKPDIIYVKNFVIKEKNGIDFKKSEKPTSGNRECRLLEVEETDFKKSKKQTSENRKYPLQEVEKADSNYTNNNYTDLSYNNSIHQSDDGMDETEIYIALIKKNLEYDFFMEHGDITEKDYLQEIFDVICDVVCVKRDTIKIGGEDYPYELVKSRFLKIKHSHVEYVQWCLSQTTTKKHNIKAYLITTLYNAPSTISHFYQQEVQHDMYGKP